MRELVTRRSRLRRRAPGSQVAGIRGKHFSLGVIQRRRDDVRIGLEGAEHDSGVIGVLECKRCRAVAGDRFAQRLQLLDAGLPESQQVVAQKGRGGDRKHGSARQEYHLQQRAANRPG